MIKKVSLIIQFTIILISPYFGSQALAQNACIHLFQSSKPSPRLQFAPTTQRYLDLNGQDVLNPSLIRDYKGNATEAYIYGRILKIDIIDLLPHLDSSLGHVLNIGGGAGVWEAFIAGFRDLLSTTLVDKTSRDINGEEFQLNTIAADIWSKNSNHPSRYIEVSPHSMKQLQDRKYRTIVSFRALAFRFPYSYYEHLIKSQLELGGTLIIDIKKTGSNLEKAMDLITAQRFEEDNQTHLEIIQHIEQTIGPVTIIRENANSLRIVARRTIQ